MYGDHERNRQSYAIEKLYLTINTLVGSGSVRQRLAEAYTRHLSPLSSEDFPEELEEDNLEIRTALARLLVEYEGQGTHRSTKNAASEEGAVLLAERLVSLFYNLVEYFLDGKK